MSIKFRRDGAVFPTSVSNGNLNIHMGTNIISIPFKFLTKEFEYDSTAFPISNIMCFLRNKEETIIMRFDGTVTKFNNDNVVIGFTKFDRQDIYDKTNYFPFGVIGTTIDWSKRHFDCSFYTIKGDKEYIYFDSGIDFEPMQLKMSENDLLIGDIMQGVRVLPRLKKVGAHWYSDDDDRYTINGTVLKTTGFLKL